MKLFGANLGEVMKKDDKNPLSSRFGTANTIDAVALKPYEMVEWEKELPINPEGYVFMNYAAHMEHLAEKGYERSPTCRELFSLIIAGFNGLLDNDMNKVVENVVMSSGEYLSTAFRVKDDTLYIYDKINSFQKNDELKKFDVPEKDRWYTDVNIFDIDGLARGDWIHIEDIAKVQPKLIEYLFTEKFDQLPDELKKRDGGSEMILPTDDEIYVIGRSTFAEQYDINLCHTEDFTSRGVREK